MKNLYLLIMLTSFFAVRGVAQITISSSDMPTVGAAYHMSTPDTLFSVDVSQTGANFNWDFSGMNAIFQVRDTFISINAVPFAIRLQLPLTANLAQLLETPDSLGPVALNDGYQIYQNSSTHFQNLGLGGTLNGIPLALVNNPTDKVYFFPLGFGDMDSSISVAQLSVPNLFFIRQERKRINEVDGWGDLSTPYGTFPTIRIRSEVSGRDSISFDTLAIGFSVPTSIQYKWLAQGMGVPVLQVNANRIDSLGGNEIVTSIRYQDSLRVFGSPNTGIFDQVQAQALQLYPNPAKDQVRLLLAERLSPDAHIKVLDLQGREIYAAPLNDNSVELLLSGFAAGSYIVQIEDRGKMYVGKLQINP